MECTGQNEGLGIVQILCHHLIDDGGRKVCQNMTVDDSLREGGVKVLFFNVKC